MPHSGRLKGNFDAHFAVELTETSRGIGGVFGSYLTSYRGFMLREEQTIYAAELIQLATVSVSNYPSQETDGPFRLDETRKYESIKNSIMIFLDALKREM